MRITSHDRPGGSHLLQLKSLVGEICKFARLHAELGSIPDDGMGPVNQAALLCRQPEGRVGRFAKDPRAPGSPDTPVPEPLGDQHAPDERDSTSKAEHGDGQMNVHRTRQADKERNNRERAEDVAHPAIPFTRTMPSAPSRPSGWSSTSALHRPARASSRVRMTCPPAPRLVDAFGAAEF